MSPPPASRTDGNTNSINNDTSETIPVSVASNGNGSAEDKENNSMLYHSSSMSMNEQLLQPQQQQQRREDRGEEEYERAVRRALAENEYVKQINSQLVDKLNEVTHENEASKKSIHKLTNVCQSMKELIIELAKAKDSSEVKARDLEKTALRQKDGKVVTLAKLEALEIGQRSMDEMATTLRGSLDVACRERDEANAKVAALTLAVEEAKKNAREEQENVPPPTGDNELEEKLALATEEIESWTQKYNESSKKVAEVTDERDTFMVKCDELQNMISSSKMDVEIWETKYSELAEQFTRVTSERNSLSETLDKKCGDWEAKYGELSERLKLATSERNALSEALDSKCAEDWETKCGELTEQMKHMALEWNSLSEALDKKCGDWETKYHESMKQLKQVTSERNALDEAIDDKMQTFSAEKKELEETIDLLARDSDEWQDKYNKSIKELVKVTTEARESMNESNRMCEEVAVEKSALQEEIINLSKQVDEQLSEKMSLQLEIDCLQRKIDGIDATNDEVRNLRQELESARASLNGASRAFDNLATENRSLKQQNILLEKERDEWVTKYNESANDMVKMTASRDSLDSELQSVRATIKDSEQKFEHDKTTLHKEIEGLTNKIDELSGVNSSLRQEVDTLKFKVEEIAAANELQVGNLRKELECSSASLTEASSSRDDLIAEIGSLRQELALFAKDNIYWQEKYVKCANDLGELTSKHAGLETELQSVRMTGNDSNGTNKDLLTENASMKNEITNLMKKIDDHSATNSNLQQEIDYLQYKLEAIKLTKEREVENLQQELKSASSLLTGSSSELEHMLAENRSLRQQIRTLKAEISSSSQIKRRLECADAKNESLSKEVDSLQYENGTLQHQIQNLQCYLSEITACHDNSIEVISPTHLQQAEKEYLSSEMEDLTAKNDALQQKNDSLQDKLIEITAAKESAAESFQTTVDSLRVQLAEREKMGDVLAQHLKDIENDVTREKEQLKLKISLLEADLNKSKQEQDRLQSAIELLQTSRAESLAHMEHDKANYEECVKSMSLTVNSEEKMKLLDMDLFQSKQEVERLHDATASMEPSQAESLAQLEGDKTGIQFQVKSMSLALDSEKEITVQRQEQLQSKISSLEADILQAKHDEDVLRNEMALLNTRNAELLAQSEQEKIELQNALKDLKLVHDAEMENVSREQNHLNSKIKSLEVELCHSKEKEDRLRDAMSLVESRHMEGRTRLEDENVGSQNKVKSLSLALDSAKMEMELLQSKIASLEEDLLRSANEEKSLRTTMELLESSHAANVANLLSRLEELTNNEIAQEKRMNLQIEELTADAESARKKLDDACIDFENQRANLTKSLEEKTLTVINLEDKMQAMSDSISALSAEAAAADEKICILQSQLDLAKDDSCREKEYLSSRIASLEADLHQSTQVEESTRSAIKSLEIRHADVRARFEDEINEVQARFASLTEKSAAEKKKLAEKVRALEARTHTFFEEGKLQQEEMSKLIQKADLTQLHLNARTVENAALAEKCHTLDNEVRKYVDRIEQLTASLKEAQTVLASMKEQNESLRNDISDAKRERDQAMSKVDGLAEELKLTAISLSEVEELISKDQVQAAETQQHLTTLKAEKKQLEESIITIKCERDKITRQLKHSQQESDDFRSKLESSHSAMELLTSRCELVESEIEASKQEAINLNKKLESSESLARAMEGEGDQLKNTIAELTTNFNDADASKKVLQLELSEAQELISRNQLEAAETQQHLRTLEAKKKQLEESIISIRSERDELIQQLGFSKQEVEDFRSKLESSHSALELITSRCELVESEIEVSKQAVINLNKKLESSESLILAKECECDQLRNTIAELRTKYNDADASNKVLQLELSEVKDLVSRDQLEFAETQQHLRTVEAEKKQMEESVTSIRSERRELIQQLEFSRQEIEDFRSKWESSHSALELMTNRCELLESQIEASKQVVVDLNAELESSKSLVTAMEGKCDQLRSTIAELATKSSDADALVKVLQLENHRNISRCKQQEERSNSEIACLENIIKSLKTEYDSFKVEAEAAATAQLRSCEAKLDSLCVMDDCDITRSQDRTFDDRITMLRKDRIQLIEKSRSTAQKLEASQEKISVLEHSVALLKEEFDAFRVEADAAATALVKSFMAQLEPICFFREGCVSELHPQTFEEMLKIIQDEISSMLKDLEVAQDEKLVLDEQVCILSTEVSKYKLQNKGLLKALNDITMNM